MSSPDSSTLDDLLADITTPMGFEVICWEWAGQGKYRVLRLYIDRLPSPAPEGEVAAKETLETEPAQPSPEEGAVAPETTESTEAVVSGVSLQDCATVSRLVGLALDAAEEQPRWAAVAASLKGAYTLEVSSPGIERPLTKLAHFARFIGKKALIRCDRVLDPSENRKKFSGPLMGVTEGPSPSVRIKDEDLQAEVDIPLSFIKKAHLVYEGRI